MRIEAHFASYLYAQPLFRDSNVNNSMNTLNVHFLLKFKVSKPQESQEEHVEEAETDKEGLIRNMENDG